VEHSVKNLRGNLPAKICNILAKQKIIEPCKMDLGFYGYDSPATLIDHVAT